MRQTWQRLCARFDALGKRERTLIFFGALLAVAVVGYQVAVAPYLARDAAAVKRLAQIQQARKEIASSLAAGEAQSRQPEAKLRAELEDARRRLAQVDAKFEAVHATLVPPEQLAALVETVLGAGDGDGVQLVSLTTLAPEPVVARPPAAGGERKARADEPDAADAAHLFRHGLQITVRGGYADLLAYLERLERMPQKMYWGRVVLATQEYPLSTLQLTVHTISFGRSWLAL